jgi:NMD protein affecting ribosome stability and mRNA decay
MTKQKTALPQKQRAPELGHRIEAHQQFRLPLAPQPGLCYCEQCGAIGFQKHWYINPAQERMLRVDKNATSVLCPGCQRVAHEEFEGEVVLRNARITEVPGEILALIKHTEGKCWHYNPLAKIAQMKEEEGIITIHTTTRFLAERIGKELRKAFKGTVEFKRSPEEKFVRVYWND